MQKFQKKTNTTKCKGTKYKCKKLQMEQIINITKRKNFKIQTRQNTNCQNTNVTKYNCNKIQMEQNTNRTKCKNTKTPKYKYLVF